MISASSKAIQFLKIRGKDSGPFARLRNGGGEGDSRFGPAAVAVDGAANVALLDRALEALLADVDALEEQVAASTATARWRAAPDATFFGFGFGSLDVLNSEASSRTRNVCGTGELLKSLK
eukprot:SAG31_NODE_1710_length_7473_cov_3.782072_5_plen_121_part_00